MPDSIKSLRENVKKFIMDGKSINEAVSIARKIQKEERRKDAKHPPRHKSAHDVR